MMYPLLLLSIIGLAVIIERVLYFSNLSSSRIKMVKLLTKTFEKGNLQEINTICRSYHVPLAYILLAGLKRHNKGKDAVNNAMDEAAIDQLPIIEKRLSVLSTIASIATLIGFTGTVIGMITAFQSIAREGVSSPSIVASGISAALITTAAGLMIAIPTIVFFHYLSHRADREIRVIEKYSKELLNFID